MGFEFEDLRLGFSGLFVRVDGPVRRHQSRNLWRIGAIEHQRSYKVPLTSSGLPFSDLQICLLSLHYSYY